MRWILPWLLLPIVIGPAFVQAETRTNHVDVWLRTEAGDRITPERNSADPYSPRKTCGACHSYAAVTSGFHFQQGFASGRTGLYRTGYAPAGFPEPVAAKANTDPKRMRLSAYDWIGAGGKLNGDRILSFAAGWLHPGGGPLEYGRDRQGKPDLSRNLVQLERSQGAKPLDGDFSSRFTPDRRSHFQTSGVIEADCLLCHGRNYSLIERNRQLSLRNYRWAATAGAGLGTIRGAVFTCSRPARGINEEGFLAGTWNFSRSPAVSYSWGKDSIFTKPGKLRGTVIARGISSAGCLQCHDMMEAIRTGTLNRAPYDAHARWGLRCTDCHRLAGDTPAERLRHNFIPAGKPGGPSCAGCHVEGKYKPLRAGIPKVILNPAKKHAQRFPGGSFHFYVISCMACHATAQPARGGYLLDWSVGLHNGFTADRIEEVFSAADAAEPAAERWKPWISRIETGKGLGEQYAAATPHVLQGFWEKTKGGFSPVRLDQVRQALKGLNPGVARVKGTAGKATAVPTISTPDEIARSLSALQKRGFGNAVFVADKIYSLRKGKLVSEPLAAGLTPRWFPVRHGVVPLKQGLTYGAKGHPEGCRDCHSDNAPFFTKMRVRNIGAFLKTDYPDPKEPNARPQMADWGIDSVPGFE